jgi:hypothetical protein
VTFGDIGDFAPAGNFRLDDLARIARCSKKFMAHLPYEGLQKRSSTFTELLRACAHGCATSIDSNVKFRPFWSRHLARLSAQRRNDL